LPEIKEMQKKVSLLGNSFDLYNYIKNNIDNIDYAKYRKMGLYIGSGHIESGNKSVVQERLKRPGMRWSYDGAQYLISLRTKLKSNLWHEVEEIILNHYNNVSNNLF
jgi:hypothetical protein